MNCCYCNQTMMMMMKMMLQMLILILMIFSTCFHLTTADQVKFAVKILIHHYTQQQSDSFVLFLDLNLT